MARKSKIRIENVTPARVLRMLDTTVDQLARLHGSVKIIVGDGLVRGVRVAAIGDAPVDGEYCVGTFPCSTRDVTDRMAHYIAQAMADWASVEAVR